MSYATKSVVFNAVPLFVLAALYLAVTVALVPTLWRERRRLSVLDAPVAALFPCIAIPAAIYGGVVLHDRQPIGGHVWPPFAATLLALLPGVLFLVRWRDRGLLATGSLRAREAEELTTIRDRELEAVSTISNALARTHDAEAAGRVLLDQVGSLFGVEFTALALISEDAREARGFLARRDGRDLAFVVDEDRAAVLELADDVGVVDDLLADVDGSPEAIERSLDRLDGAFHPGAVPPRRGEENSLHQTAGHRSREASRVTWGTVRDTVREDRE